MVQCVETEESKFLEPMRNLFNMYRFKPRIQNFTYQCVGHGPPISGTWSRVFLFLPKCPGPKWEGAMIYSNGNIYHWCASICILQKIMQHPSELSEFPNRPSNSSASSTSRGRRESRSSPSSSCWTTDVCVIKNTCSLQAGLDVWLFVLRLVDKMYKKIIRCIFFPRSIAHVQISAYSSKLTSEKPHKQENSNNRKRTTGGWVLQKNI